MHGKRVRERRIARPCSVRSKNKTVQARVNHTAVLAQVALRDAFTTIRTSRAGITADSHRIQQLGSRMLRVCFAYAIRIASVTTDVGRRRVSVRAALGTEPRR